MLLQNRKLNFKVPHTSTCIVKTTGVIQDGDVIDVVSPVFASVDFRSGSIETTESFKVPIVILNESRSFDNSTGDVHATLVCDDNDIFHMYVRVQ